MIATTISNSIRVNPSRDTFGMEGLMIESLVSCLG
jgi:hypothetical protein